MKKHIKYCRFGGSSFKMSNKHSVGNKEEIYSEIYICCSPKDTELANATEELMYQIGLEEKQVIKRLCKEHVLWLKTLNIDKLRESEKKILIFYLITDNIYNDIFFNQQIGAHMILNLDYVSIKTSTFNVDKCEEKSIISSLEIDVNLSNDKELINDEMRKLRVRIENCFKINKISENRWEKCRDKYLNKFNLNQTSSLKETENLTYYIAETKKTLHKISVFSIENLQNLGFDSQLCRQIIQVLISNNEIKKLSAGRYEWIT